MSIWEKHSVEEKIKEILSEVKYSAKPDHHFGTPYLTAYQLAIELNKRYPVIAVEIGYKVGGKGTNGKNSLSQYLALQLSKNIGDGKITDIEGAFLSNTNLEDIIFDNNNEKLISSSTDSQYDLSMYRLKIRF